MAKGNAWVARQQLDNDKEARSLFEIVIFVYC